MPSSKDLLQKVAKFIDLFAGLGGFHKALSVLGHECVFASEIDPVLRKLYEENWGMEPYGDIRQVVPLEVDKIPEHDILCAGFPCQPFSKAGKQLGRNDAQHGTLFDEIVRILKVRRPIYFILENVPHLANHDNEETWKYMKGELEKLGYTVDHKNYSPHGFGIPQHRLRIFIVGSQIGLNHFGFENVDKHKVALTKLNGFVEKNPVSAKAIPARNVECLDLWQEFLNAIPKTVKLPTFPIWGMEFNATYPFEGASPSELSSRELGNHKGSFGKRLANLKKADQLSLLPSYARTKQRFPEWKRFFIRSNRHFFEENRKHIKDIMTRIAKTEFQSWQKLEWNVGDGVRDIRRYLLQFRASGIRVKKPDFFPSLVCSSTQIPIVGWEDRYISRNEGLRLQALDGLKLPEYDAAAFRALGNAVNARIVTLIAKELLFFEEEQLSEKTEAACV
jgi:DNA (cytosine-5)-methyltransferase 1